MRPHRRVTDVTRSTEVVGRFVVDLDTERWWWSDEMYRLHGFEPHEAIPTTELMLTHREAAEGPSHEPTLRDLADAVESGEVFGSTYRIVDATGQHRTVALVGSVHRAGPDEPRQIEVLRAHSNQANVKLHSLAEHLVRYGPSRSEHDAPPHVGDPVLAHRLGLSAAGPEALTIETTWPSPRHAVVTLAGRVEETDIGRIDECMTELVALRPSVLAVRLDLRRSTGPAAALPALRKALVRFHHASISVSVVEDDTDRGQSEPDPSRA